MSMKKIIIIGGGPGGYVAAIRAAQLGAEVHLVEGASFGGTCLNVGCIPTKALLHTAEMYQAVKKGALIGLKVDQVAIDWTALMGRKKSVVDRLVKGVEGLLKANGVKTYRGMAKLHNSRTVVVDQATVLQGDAVILAVGSSPVKLSFPGADLPGVIDSTGALSLPQAPSSMVIIGGGVIGVEFAALYNATGCRVTVVEMMDEILPGVDREVACHLRRELEQQGVSFRVSAKLTEVTKNNGELAATLQTSQGSERISGQYVLIAVGRRARTENIGLETAGIKTDRGRIIVNDNFVTTTPGVYAIGDCNGKIMLAHAASAQGVAAVEHALGHKSAYYDHIVPACIYTHPEVAGVGLTEEQAKAQKLSYRTGVFPLAANGKSVIEDGAGGFVKIISGTKYGEILGVHMIGPRATDIIAEAAIAIRLEATVDELVSTIHAHPTISEAMAEAALAVSGTAIHWPPPVKRR